MNLFITGSNRQLCKKVSKLCADAGFTVCKSAKAPKQLFSDKTCNCAVRRTKGIFSVPMDPKLGSIFLKQLSESNIKVIFIDDQTNHYNNLVSKHLAKKNSTYIHLTLTANLILSQPQSVTALIKSRFEL